MIVRMSDWQKYQSLFGLSLIFLFLKLNSVRGYAFLSSSLTGYQIYLE